VRIYRWNCLLLMLVLCQSFMTSVEAEQEVTPETKDLAQELISSFINDRLPAELELYYFANTENDDQSPAIRYNWNATNKWVDDSGDSGMDFSGSRSNFFARGNYVFQDDVNPSELSEIGASWTHRWFPINIANPLTTEQGIEVQECIKASSGFDTTVEDCRNRLGFGSTQLSYWYTDLSFHGKVEGDQSFDQRNYVYGAKTSLSRNFGAQKLFLNPILTLGIDQVDPKGNLAREAVGASDDIYTRAYGAFGFTGILARVKDQNIKLNFSVRHFQEISPEEVISNAGLDDFTYTVIAFQVPAAIFPGLDNPRNSFVLSYATGELPFNVTSETTIELGFRHDVDFAEFF